MVGDVGGDSGSDGRVGGGGIVRVVVEAAVLEVAMVAVMMMVEVEV